MQKMPAITDVEELHTRQAQRTGRWASIYLILIIITMFALVGRVLQLKIDPDPRLPKAIDASTSSRTELARRGRLLDRAGRVVATTTVGHRLFVDPAMVR